MGEEGEAGEEAGAEARGRLPCYRITSLRTDMCGSGAELCISLYLIVLCPAILFFPNAAVRPSGPGTAKCTT
mgnify:CR=1 FL=1